MRVRYLLSAATTCLLLTSGLAYAQTPAEARKDEPRKERVEKDQQPAKGGETRSETKPQETTRERGEAGVPRQAGEEHGKALNAAERNGAANPDEAKRARGEAAKPNEHADESRHEGATQSAHENREERTKSSATPKAETPAAEKSSQEKSAEETRKSKTGATANENSQTQRNEAAKSSPPTTTSQQSQPQGNKGAAANETDRAKASNEAQRGATNAAQPNTAAASSQLPRDKEVRISETLKQHELAPPERNLNISISVGAEIPDRVRVHRLPPEIVSIAPEYRDYDYFSTEDDIVIVEPRTHRIVSQIPRDPSRSRAEIRGGETTAPTATNVAGGPAGPCQIQKRDASGQLTEVSPTTVGSTAQSRNSIAVIVQTQDQRSSAAIALDAPAGQIIVATQGPGDCRVTIEPEPAR